MVNLLCSVKLINTELKVIEAIVQYISINIGHLLGLLAYFGTWAVGVGELHEHHGRLQFAPLS